MPLHETHINAPPNTAPDGSRLAALTRVFAKAAKDLQRCAALESDRTIDRVLGDIGRAMDAQRAYVFEVVDSVFIRNTHEWCAVDVDPMQPHLQHVPYSVCALFWERFVEFGSIHIEDVDNLLQTSDLRQVLEKQNIRALIAAPFWQNGEMFGFVGLDYTEGPRSFSNEDDNLMRGFAAQTGMLRALKRTSRETLRLETDLARARAQLGATVAALPELLVETDRDGIIIGFQQSAPLIFAASPQEVIGQPPEAVLPAHLARICRKAMREVDLFGWSQSHSYSVDTPLGPKWFTLYATRRTQVAKDIDATSPGYLFVVRDVTHAQRQDQRIRQLVRVAELSTNLIMLTDKERRIRWLNPAAVERTGYNLHSAENMLPSEILHLAQTEPEMVQELCHTLDRGHAIQRELRAQARDGAIYWLELNVQPLHDAIGAIEGYMVMGIDTTSHKQAEARLLQDRSLAMRASHEGIAIIRPNGRLSYANPALRRFLSIEPDTRLEALMWTDITPPNLTERMTGILPILMSEGVWEGEFTRKLPDGTTGHFNISLSVETDGSTLALIRDITRRHHAELDRARLHEQLQKAQSRELSAQLAAGLAHDFANVLATITGSVDQLAPHVAQSEMPVINRIRSATLQARELARSLTRLETERPEATSLSLAAQSTQTPLADTSILLVDNDDLLLQNVADMLAQAGAEVASCIHPSDALETITLAPHEWDMVLTDFDMDGMTGSELAEALHQQRQDLPIILMTGNNELHFATESVQTEFAATLRKPICKTVLISVLLAAKLRSQRHI